MCPSAGSFDSFRLLHHDSTDVQTSKPAVPECWWTQRRAALGGEHCHRTGAPLLNYTRGWRRDAGTVTALATARWCVAVETRIGERGETQHTGESGMPAEHRLVQRDPARAEHKPNHKLVSPFHPSEEDVLASSRAAREQRRARRIDASRVRTDITVEATATTDQSNESSSTRRSSTQHDGSLSQCSRSAESAHHGGEAPGKENTISQILSVDSSASERGGGTDEAIGRGLLWSARECPTPTLSSAEMPA